MTGTADAGLADAHRLGAEAGSQRNKFAADCPYQHTSFALREAWMQGFSEGRIESGIAKRVAAGADS